MSARSICLHFVSVALVLLLVVAVGLAVPHLALASSPLVAPPAQQIPMPNSIVPAIIQIALIIAATQGLKALARAFGHTLEDQAAALAYIITGVLVFGVGKFIPTLPPDMQSAVGEVLQLFAVLLTGSGLFDMAKGLRSRSLGGGGEHGFLR